MDNILQRVFGLPDAIVAPFDEDMADVVSLCSGVATGRGGLIWHGVTNMPRSFLYLATDHKEYQSSGLRGMAFVYQDPIDSSNYLIDCPYNPAVKIPTLERSIVDYQRFDAGCMDDEHFTEAVEEYSKMHHGDFSKLYEVADFYGCLPLIKEAIELAKTYFS